MATTFTRHISARASLTIACALGLLAFIPAAVSAQGDAALPPPGTGGGPGWSVVPSSDVNGNDNDDMLISVSNPDPGLQTRAGIVAEVSVRSREQCC